MLITKAPFVVALGFTLLLTSVNSQTRKPKTVKTKPPAPKPAPTKPAAPISILSQQEQELVTEINQARANPAAYVAYLLEYKTYYQQEVVRFPDGSKLVTNEGVRPLDEAIAFLRTLKPLPPFAVKKGMVSAAKVHIDDLKKTQGSGHTGSDGSKPEDRLNRYGMWDEAVAENIVYQARSTRNDLIGMIIDDGVGTRGHRKNLFKSGFKVIGISYGGPVNGKTICVLTFAGGFTDKPESTKPTATKY
jgi:uncharacterized protein YkwD